MKANFKAIRTGHIGSHQQPELLNRRWVRQEPLLPGHRPHAGLCPAI